MSKHARLALVLGGGAPNATLMAGAVTAFIQNNINFDIISTSGAGAIVGLLYQVSRQGDPQAALKSLVQMGVSDTIHSLCPINYKVFNKPGVMADAWRAMQLQNPMFRLLQEHAHQGVVNRLMADWAALLTASLCPSDLTSASKGLCAHVPFITEIVDFDKLKTIQPEFYLNAYNLSRHKMVCWNKQTIRHEHFLAALSFPFIYPPYVLDGEYYIEGAALDTLNLKQLFTDYQRIDCTVVCDVLGCEKLLHPPRDLHDAWVQSIITPLTEIARDDIKLFESHYNAGGRFTRLLKVPFNRYITPEVKLTELDWSYSNLKTLFDIGVQAGQDFCAEHRAVLHAPKQTEQASKAPRHPQPAIAAKRKYVSWRLFPPMRNARLP